MELFEEIRRDYEHGEGTIKGIARKLGVHRRMVREAIASAVPRERKVAVRKKPKLGPAITFINTILEADQKAPRKQRHTAHRIWRRLCEEKPDLNVSEPTVGKYVRERKHEMGLIGRETFIPQSYRFGEQAQVDWYEAYAYLDEERQKLYIFCKRSMASGGAFHRAYPHASQQAFLEAHEVAEPGLLDFPELFRTQVADINLVRRVSNSFPVAPQMPAQAIQESGVLRNHTGGLRPVSHQVRRVNKHVGNTLENRIRHFYSHLPGLIGSSN